MINVVELNFIIKFPEQIQHKIKTLTKLIIQYMIYQKKWKNIQGRKYYTKHLLRFQRRNYKWKLKKLGETNFILTESVEGFLEAFDISLRNLHLQKFFFG